MAPGLQLPGAAPHAILWSHPLLWRAQGASQGSDLEGQEHIKAVHGSEGGQSRGAAAKGQAPVLAILYTITESQHGVS